MTSFPAAVDLADVDGDQVVRLESSGVDWYPDLIGVLDVNGDGLSDIVIGGTAGTTVRLGQWGPLQPVEVVDNSYPGSNIDWLPSNGYVSEIRPVGLGDINGDGFGDFDSHTAFYTLTYYYYEMDSWWQQEDFNAVDIFYGGSDGATSGELIQSHNWNGLYLEAVGDVNGDGFDDVWVNNHSAGSHGGFSHVVFGSPTGIPANANSPAAPGLSFTGGTASVAGALGDVNGDGMADLLVSASSGDNTGLAVVFGRSDLATQAFDISTLDGTNGFWLPGAGSAAKVGDVNGDGLDDILITLSGRAASDPFYIVYGRADAPASVDASSVDGVDGFRVLGATKVSAIGDINGDGRDDLFTTATWFQSYVVFMPADVGADGLDASSVDGDNGFQVSGYGAWSVCAAGDINGDGFDDIAAGVDGGDGAVGLILGHAGSAVDRVGTSAREHITGSLESDVLNGAGGNDLLRGLDGDDLLIGGSGGDILSGGEGIDTASFATGSHGVVVDLVAGTASGRGLGNDTLISIESVIGSLGDDDIAGTDGDNRIDGNLGADRMAGRLGDDVYVIDNVGDQVLEGRNQGHDAVETSLADYVLAPHVEDLTFVGSGDFRGTGNTLANVIVGGAGNDVLNGSLGGDTMRGGAGDDLYIVDQGGDIVEESADSGFDTVHTEWSYTLTDHVEALVLRGTAGASGTGNDLANALTGNDAANVLSGLGGDDTLSGKAGADRLLGGDGNDRLDGGSGDDVLRGGLGDDIYVVDSLGDQLSEANGGGLDTVLTSLSFTLASGFENLTILTSQAVDGTGNSAANVLIGGNGANVLAGLRGSDTLTGAGGADIFVFGTGFGQDRITDFASNDVIKFENGLFADLADVKAHATQVGDDILIAWSAGNTITIDEYLLTKLNAGDFLFA
ncbi:calcium-binding protein [Zavarzinia sp.]|uniref:calcium-binding protein n=1 Tax=Zavarzinia sp. TaxID=2027920 RepID=UPI003BB4E14A